MSTAKVYTLEQCCEIVSGATPKTSIEEYWDGDICWATPKDLSDLDSHYIYDTPRKITKNGLTSCSASVLPVGSVLFSSRAPIGHVAVNTVPMATNQGFKSFIPKAGILDAKFLFHWLKKNRVFLENLGNGATFKEVSKATVARIEISLPPIADQRRIAAILDQADALRAKRREALAQLDSLTQSIFIEMFGNPLANPMGWPCFPLSQLGNTVTGNTPSRAIPDYYGNAVEWIKSDNINTPYYYITSASESLSESGRLVGKIVPPLSILVTCIAGSPECIGNSAMTDREVAFNQQINAFIPLKIDPHFAYAQFKVGKRLFQDASTNGMKGMVSKSRFEQIIVMAPPKTLQQAFATRTQSVESLKANHRIALNGLDALFASLQHHAFTGQL